MRSYEAAVIGLGGMGSAILAHLAARGTHVVGLEQYGPAHALGASHGGSRIIRQAYYEHPAYVPLLLRAYELWDELQRRSGEHLLLRTGGLMVGAPESKVVSGALRSAREHGLVHQLLEASDLRRRFSVLRPLQHEVALYEEQAGLLFPEACVLAHLRWAVEAGAEARFGTQVRSWWETGRGVELELAGGERIQAEQLIVAAGAWLGKTARDAALPLRVERNVLHWFEPLAHREDFAADRFPVYLLEREGTPMLYGFPDLPGQGIKAAFHHSQEYTDLEHLARDVAAEEIAALKHALEGWAPDAVGRHLRSSVCMYTVTPDEHFVIGRHPTHPHVVLAGGFSGHGYKFCAVIGEAVAGLVVDGASPHAIDLFAPQRFVS
ncbi:N-methyl-L-tryptophan oxidase [bacterium]|nr:MAG: N-methyl-L-tryptophan oxidase [bacterium]